MGFVNLARDMVREMGGRKILSELRKGGKIVAPGLTRRISKGVHKNRKLIRSITKVAGGVLDVADAASVGDLAGGLHAGVHLGQTAAQVFKKAKQTGRAPRNRRLDKLQTRMKRIGREVKKSGPSNLENFDSGSANDPKISGDLLARMTKSVRS